MTFEIAQRLRSTVDLVNVTVKPFDGYIFLCGGTIEGSAVGLASARHYALSRRDADGRIAGRRVVLAEAMTSLLQGDDFHDLLEFEEHIAALCACVLLFVESPGSIAELGSFSVMKHLAPRLLVVCEQQFESTTNPSFIFLGPIASLKRHRNEAVQIFPIFSASESSALAPDKDLLDDCWVHIEEAVLESLRRPISESQLASSLLAHQMVLTATLVDLAVAVKVGELEECLQLFGVALSPKALRRILRMLEQFELIRSQTYGNDRYYHALLSHPVLTLRPVGTHGGIFDPLRFKADAIAFYSEHDERRAKAIRAFARTLRR